MPEKDVFSSDCTIETCSRSLHPSIPGSLIPGSLHSYIPPFLLVFVK